MHDKTKDQTTRWENVKGRAQWLSEHMDAAMWLKEFGAPLPEGAVFAFALCEEMDRMQKEIDRLRDMLTKHVSYKTIRRYDVEEPKE